MEKRIHTYLYDPQKKDLHGLTLRYIFLLFLQKSKKTLPSAPRLLRAGRANGDFISLIAKKISGKKILPPWPLTFTIAISPLLLFSLPLLASQSLENLSDLPLASDDQATQFPRGEISYGTKTPITLNRSGVYQLTGPLTAAAAVAALTLSANNITLDLQGNVISGGATGINVTGNQAVVKNGVVRNTGGTGTVGVKISGSQGQFENLDVISTQSGFLLQNTNSNQLTNCRAIASTNAGFSLVSSSTNNFNNCQALSTNGGNNGAYGFISQSGYGNNFEQCVAQDTRTSSINSAIISAGFLLSAETASTINESSAIGTLSTTGTALAFGILAGLPLQYTASTLSPLDNKALTVTVYSVAWSPNGQYLAVGSPLDAFNTSIRIYSWDPQHRILTAIPGATANAGSTAQSIAWSPNGQYLAVGALDNVLRIYTWNGSTLSGPATITIANTSSINNVGWSPNGTYIATGGNPNVGSNAFNVFYWDGTVPMLKDSAINSITQSAVTWLTNTELVSAGINSGGNTHTFSFNGSTLTPGTTYTIDVTVKSLAKSPIGNYLAIGTDTNTRIYSYSGTTLTAIPSAIQSHGNTVYSVSWTPDGQTVIIGGAVGAGTKYIRMYSWIYPTLTTLASFGTPPGAIIISISTLSNYIFASGGMTPSDNFQLRVWGDPRATQNSIITKNTTSKTTTLYGQGVGMCASSANYIAQNLGYANDINFQSISSSYLASQANARGVDNVDTSLTTADMVETINTNVANLLPEGFSINSKTDVVSSKIDHFANTNLSCAFTPIQNGGTTTTNKNFITGPITLSQSGDYCLSGNCSGGITVSGNNITLDLNNYTLNGGNNGLTISGNSDIIRNGTIKNATSNGVTITGSRCMLENLDVVGSPTGFYIANAGYNLLNNCQALNCTQNGFYLNGGTRNTLTNCSVSNLGGSTASSTVVSGFLSSGGQANIFDSCTVENAFTNVNSANAQAQGFAIAAEDYSTIANCTVNGVSTNQALPNLYGIRCPMLLDSVATTTGALNKVGHAVSWLEYQGQRYLAAGLTATPPAGPEVDIFKYTGTNLLFAAGINPNFDVFAVAWLTSSNNINYLAIGLSNTTPTTLQIYTFTPPSTITAAGSTNIASAVVSLDWLASCTSGSQHVYVAAGTQTLGAKIFEYRGGTLLGPVTASTGASWDVNWLQAANGKTYLVTSGNTAPKIRVFEFLGSGLNQIVTANATSGNVFAARWLTTNTGNYYLATGEGSESPEQIRIFKFDPDIPSLTQIATYANNATKTSGVPYVVSVSWLPGIDDLNYLAIGGQAETSANHYEIRILRFDGSCLTPIFNYTPSKIDTPSYTIEQVDWLATGSTVLAFAHHNNGVAIANPVQALGFSPTRNQIYNNNVTNVNGGASATAYAVDANNLLIQNLASNNGTDYYYTPQPGDSNQAF